jgi:hypothetical protein
MDKWDWLIHRARDAGLYAADLAHLNYTEAIEMVANMEALWEWGRTPYWGPQRSPAVTNGELKAALVERLDLPILALKLSLSELRELGEKYYELSPTTLRPIRVHGFDLEITTPLGNTITYSLEGRLEHIGSTGSSELADKRP